eukprot:TRINITY_DN6427_c0_g1_i1.p1 TRINITY_DN6427_c0_g1~~TRINITY_DN6427_c0_g1_i1.p1  ORF type:complete len:199 (+),score=26.18 TRINITY_DN6427_c0_g1_i1:2-598(+)
MKQSMLVVTIRLINLKDLKIFSLKTFSLLMLYLCGKNLMVSNFVKACQLLVISQKSIKLFGTNLQEEALIDMIIEGILDISQALLPYRIKFSSATSVEEKLNLKKEMKEEKISVWFARYERMLKKNGEGLGFFVGDSFTFADIGVWLYLEFAEDIELLDLTNLPLLAKFKERMEARPNIDLYRKSQRFPIQNPFKIEA